MGTWRIWGRVIGQKYLGEFEAKTELEAKRMAMASPGAKVELCAGCKGRCEDAEVDPSGLTAEHVPYRAPPANEEPPPAPEPEPTPEGA